MGVISSRFGGLVGDYIQGWLLSSRETNPLIGALGSAVTIAGAGRVAELADAQDSGSCPGNRVEVQVLSRPPRSGCLSRITKEGDMSRQALTLAKTGLEAWRQGDFDVIEGLLDPAVEWHWFEP